MSKLDKAIIYTRVSSKDQEVEGYSIPAQIKILQEYAASNNLKIVKSFIEVETAKKIGRTQFNDMLVFLKNEPLVKHILVEKTDRLHRNITDYAAIDQLIENSDINVHLVKEHTILSKDSNSHAKFMHGMHALMAKHYSDNLSEEVKKGMKQKAAQGTYPSRAPYGYLNTVIDGKKVIVINPDTAPSVKKMFELYATGSYSLLKLREKMIEDGIPEKNRDNFYTSHIESILKSEFYIGSFSWGNRRFENASHEPLISKDLFLQVQESLRNPHKIKSRKGLFPYTNFIKCGVCGYVLTAEIKKEKYIYYHCTGYKSNCKQGYLKAEVIDQKFEEILGSIHISEEIQGMIIQSLKSSLKDKVEYHNKVVQQTENQIKFLQNRIDNAYMDKIDGKITEEFWKLHSPKWLEEKERLTIKLLALQKADKNYLENANIILELSKKAITLFKKQNANEKRRLIDILTSNCSYQDGKLDVKLKPVFEVIAESGKTGVWCAQEESNPQPSDP